MRVVNNGLCLELKEEQKKPDFSQKFARWCWYASGLISLATVYYTIKWIWIAHTG